MASPELIGIAIGVLAILMTIVGMGIVILQKVESGDARNEERSERRSDRIESRVDRVDAKVDAKVDEVKTELKADIAEVETELKADIAQVEADIAESDARAEARSAAVIAELRSFRESVENRMNGTEREQARQEGALSVLIQRDRAAGRNGESETSESPH